MSARPRRLLWPALTAGEHPLPEALAHYVLRVLRLAPGAPLALFDGTGTTAAARLLQLADGSFAVQVEAPQREAAQGAQISIAVALPKGERADWIVEKCTELGADEIVWLQCARSVVAPHSLANKMARWQRLAEAAARQAQRNTLPTLRGPLPLLDVLGEARSGLRLLAHPQARPQPWPTQGQGHRQARVVIGPEGGLTEEELQHAQAAGYSVWSFNRHILRVETAAVAAATLLAGWAAIGEEPA